MFHVNLGFFLHLFWNFHACGFLWTEVKGTQCTDTAENDPILGLILMTRLASPFPYPMPDYYRKQR